MLGGWGAGRNADDKTSREPAILARWILAVCISWRMLHMSKSWAGRCNCLALDTEVLFSDPWLVWEQDSGLWTCPDEWIFSESVYRWDEVIPDAIFSLSTWSWAALLRDRPESAQGHLLPNLPRLLVKTMPCTECVSWICGLMECTADREESISWEEGIDDVGVGEPPAGEDKVRVFGATAAGAESV